MMRYDDPDDVVRDTDPLTPREVDRAGAETEDIRVEIEQTRTEMSGTIDAIQQKLDPDVLAERATVVVEDVTEQAIRRAKEAALEATDHAVEGAKGAAREMTGQAKEAAWDATVGRAEQAVGATFDKAEAVVSSAGQTARGVGSTMLETVKQHPLPAALAALSIGWLFMNRSSAPTGRTASASFGAGRTPYAYGTSGTSGMSGARAPYRGRQAVPADEGPGTLGGVAEKVGETADQVRDKAGQAASSAGELAGELAGSAGDVASSAGEVARDAGAGILETIKQNPVPAALTGLGLAWLYMNRSSGPPGRTTYRAYGDGGTSYPYGAGGTYYGSRERGTVGGVADKVGETAGQVQEKAGELVGQVQDAAGSVVDEAQDRAQWAGSRVQQMLRTNPLMAGALAATVGGAVGLALPETRREDELLGKARDSVMGQAREVTQETVEKVERVAEGAKKQAEEQGLTV